MLCLTCWFSCDNENTIKAADDASLKQFSLVSNRVKGNNTTSLCDKYICHFAPNAWELRASYLVHSMKRPSIVSEYNMVQPYFLQKFFTKKKNIEISNFCRLDNGIESVTLLSYDTNRYACSYSISLWKYFVPFSIFFICTTYIRMSI